MNFAVSSNKNKVRKRNRIWLKTRMDTYLLSSDSNWFGQRSTTCRVLSSWLQCWGEFESLRCVVHVLGLSVCLSFFFPQKKRRWCKSRVCELGFDFVFWVGWVQLFGLFYLHIRTFLFTHIWCGTNSFTCIYFF